MMNGLAKFHLTLGLRTPTGAQNGFLQIFFTLDLDPFNLITIRQQFQMSLIENELSKPANSDHS